MARQLVQNYLTRLYLADEKQVIPISDVIQMLEGVEQELLTPLGIENARKYKQSQLQLKAKMNTRLRPLLDDAYDAYEERNSRVYWR